MFATSMLNIIVPMLAYQVLNGPLGGMIVFFSMLGVVFIVKAVGHLGKGVWGALKGELLVIWRDMRFRQKLFRDDKAGIQTAPNSEWHKKQIEEVAGIGDAAHVLFPGQPSFAETLTLAYSEEEDDEALFYLCCKEELEDILAEAGEIFGKSTPRETLPLHFLPQVTAEIQDNKPQQLKTTTAMANSLHREESRNTEKLLQFSRRKGDYEPSDALNAPGINEAVSIFEELLLKCDMESRLALMPELLAVGDEKELRLLESMTHIGDKRVQKLAKKLCAKLRKQLQQKSGQEGGPLNDGPQSSKPSSKDPDGEHHEKGPVEAAIEGDNKDDKISLDLCFLREEAKQGLKNEKDC